MKPVQRKGKKQNGDCFNCGHCQYHSEGDSYCDLDYEFVLEDWCPTDEFLHCNGKHWTKN